jgi:hypothetical protein
MGIGPYTVSFIASNTVALGRSWSGQIGVTAGADLLVGGEATSVFVGAARSHAGRWHYATLAAGPALVHGHEGRSTNGFAGGAVFTAQMVFVPFRPIGIGVFALAHANPIRSGVGAGIVLALIATK